MKICSNRSERLIKVEEVRFKDKCYSIFIYIPGEKSECDFFVLKYDENKEIKIPSHDNLAEMYNSLKNKSNIIEEYLINSVIRFLRDRKDEEEIIESYFSIIQEELKFEIKKFFATLKWISFQEDVNYPPPKKLGSKFILAVFALIESGFKIQEIRRILRFRSYKK